LREDLLYNRLWRETNKRSGFIYKDLTRLDQRGQRIVINSIYIARIKYSHPVQSWRDRLRQGRTA
jgi:hypothetical protein